MSGGSMNCSLRYPLTRVRLRVISNGAMFLSDRSAYAHYVDLAEQGYYNRIISGNMSQRIGIDSVRCDFNTYPYEVVTYAKLSIIREKSVTGTQPCHTWQAAELHPQRQ